MRQPFPAVARDAGTCLSMTRAIGQRATAVRARRMLPPVLDVDAKGEARFRLHGQVRLDSPWPAGIYSACCWVAAPSPTSASLPAQPSRQAAPR